MKQNKYLCTMTEHELNTFVRQAAIDNGLCQAWKTDWHQDWSNQKLVNKFYSGIDFFLEKRFISNQFIKEAMSIPFLRDNAILVDDEYSIINPFQREEKTHYAITLGDTKSKIRLNDRNIATCYICDNSKVTVYARHNSFALVHLFHKAKLIVHTYDEAKVTILVHSEDATYAVDGLDKSYTVKKELDYLK